MPTLFESTVPGLEEFQSGLSNLLHQIAPPGFDSAPEHGQGLHLPCARFILPPQYAIDAPLLDENDPRTTTRKVQTIEIGAHIPSGPECTVARLAHVVRAIIEESADPSGQYFRKHDQTTYELCRIEGAHDRLSLVHTSEHFRRDRNTYGRVQEVNDTQTINTKSIEISEVMTHLQHMRAAARSGIRQVWPPHNQPKKRN